MKKKIYLRGGFGGSIISLDIVGSLIGNKINTLKII